MIESVDTELGRLVNGIDAANLAKTTILIVSDNGTPPGVIKDSPYRGLHGKGSPYEQGTQVALV